MHENSDELASYVSHHREVQANVQRNRTLFFSSSKSNTRRKIRGESRNRRSTLFSNGTSKRNDDSDNDTFQRQRQQQSRPQSQSQQQETIQNRPVRAGLRNKNPLVSSGTSTSSSTANDESISTAESSNPDLPEATATWTSLPPLITNTVTTAGLSSRREGVSSGVLTRPPWKPLRSNPSLTSAPNRPNRATTRNPLPQFNGNLPDFIITRRNDIIQNRNRNRPGQRSPFSSLTAGDIMPPADVTNQMTTVFGAATAVPTVSAVATSTSRTGTSQPKDSTSTSESKEFDFERFESVNILQQSPRLPHTHSQKSDMPKGIPNPSNFRPIGTTRFSIPTTISQTTASTTNNDKRSVIPLQSFWDNAAAASSGGVLAKSRLRPSIPTTAQTVVHSQYLTSREFIPSIISSSSPPLTNTNTNTKTTNNDDNDDMNVTRTDTINRASIPGHHQSPPDTRQVENTVP